MRKWFAPVLVLWMLLGLAAQAETLAPEVAGDSVKEGYAFEDGTLKISLWENASTGFAWDFDVDDETVLEYGGEEVIPEGDGGDVGAPSMHIWRFAPKDEGEALVTFYYERPDEENEYPDRMLCYTVTVEDGKITDCFMEDLSEDDDFGEEEAVVPYAGETGGVDLDVFQDMTEAQTPEGTLLTSEDELITILINYEPDDDPDELFEQLKDDESAAKIYDDEENGISVISSGVELDEDVPYVTMVYYVPGGIAEYTGYKAPDGGVLHVHTTYLLGDDEIEMDWPEELGEIEE